MLKTASSFKYLKKEERLGKNFKYITMKKLGKLKLNLEKMLSHEDLVSIRGGSGPGGSGTCGWDGGGMYPPVCGVSMDNAQALQTQFGGWWCCDQCCQTAYCYSHRDCGYFI